MFQDFFTSVSKYKIPGNRIKMFEWIKTIALLDPTIYPILLILAEYPITDITLNVVGEAKLDKGKLEKHKKDAKYKMFVEQDVTGHLMDIGLEAGMLGNAFVSPSSAVKRKAICPKCKYSGDLAEFADIKVSIDKSIPKGRRDKEKKVKFKGKCPHCKYNGDLSIEEKPDLQHKKMVKWDPMDIDIKYSEYDGFSRYFYRPSANMQGMFAQHDTHLLATADKSLLYSLLTGKQLEIKTIYHFRTRGASMIWPGWALPPILPVLTTVWYMNLLTRAQEAVALDFLVPLRVLYYQNADADGKIKTSSKRFKRMLEAEVKKWRQDPNRIVALPFPVQQLELLYGGRNLLLSPELQFGQQRIAMGLGFPPSVLSGDMTYSGGSVTLRMLANRFATMTASYRRYLNEFYRKYMFPDSYRDIFEIGMTKFQIADDMSKMQLLLQSDLLSRQSMFEMLGVDSDTEQARKMQDAVDAAKLQVASQGVQADAQKAMSVMQAMGQTISDPEGLKMVMAQPTQQMYKFITDYMQLPDECVGKAPCKPKVQQMLEEEMPEVWYAMDEIMRANGLTGSSIPGANVGTQSQTQQKQQQQAGPQQQSQGGKQQQPSAVKAQRSEAEAGSPKLFKEKTRASGDR